MGDAMQADAVSLRAEVSRLKERYAGLHDRAEMLNRLAEDRRVECGRVRAAAERLAAALMECSPDPMNAGELGAVQRARAEALSAWEAVKDPADDLRKAAA